MDPEGPSASMFISGIGIFGCLSSDEDSSRIPRRKRNIPASVGSFESKSIGLSGKNPKNLFKIVCKTMTRRPAAKLNLQSQRRLPRLAEKAMSSAMKAAEQRNNWKKFVRRPRKAKGEIEER